jgi:hypothetical protein
LPSGSRVVKLRQGNRSAGASTTAGDGDTDIVDWGGLFGAIIGTLIVLGLAGYFPRRRQPHPTCPATRGRVLPCEISGRERPVQLRAAPADCFR